MQYTPLSPSIPSPRGEGGGKNHLKRFIECNTVCYCLYCVVFLAMLAVTLEVQLEGTNLTLLSGSRYFPNSTVWGVSSSDFSVLL